MSLTDEQIAAIGEEHGLCTRVEDAAYIADMLWFDGELFTFARAVESAATAPLLERIAELERDMAAMTAKLTVERSHSAELEALRKDAGWRPIETAPKNTNVLVVSELGNIWMAQFRFVGPRIGEAWRTSLGSLAFRPVLWMPLPPAPDAAKEQG
jgi:hypothetical protein